MDSIRPLPTSPFKEYSGIYDFYRMGVFTGGIRFGRTGEVSRFMSYLGVCNLCNLRRN